LGTTLFLGEQKWISNTHHFGTTAAWLSIGVSNWYLTLGNAAGRTVDMLSHAILVYCCWVIWNDYRILAMLPVLHVGTSSLGVAFLVSSSLRSTSYFLGRVHQLQLARNAAAVGLNAVPSSLISGRLDHSGRSCSGVVVGAAVRRRYTTAAAIVVESALLYTAAGVAFVVSFAYDQRLGRVLLLSRCIAPQLIIFRVLAGRAW
ncbi:hypothetical protein BD413DRAFT_443191, partial [Trametes elegans]